MPLAVALSRVPVNLGSRLSILGRFMWAVVESHWDYILTAYCGFAMYHSADASYPCSSACCSYQKDKWAKAGFCERQLFFGNRGVLIVKHLNLVFEGLIWRGEERPVKDLAAAQHLISRSRPLKNEWISSPTIRRVTCSPKSDVGSRGEDCWRNVRGCFVGLSSLHVNWAWSRNKNVFQKTAFFLSSMERRPSWGADRFSATQETFHILLNPKVHYRSYNSPPPVLSWAGSFQCMTLSQFLRSVLILSFHLLLGLEGGLLPSGFPTETLYSPLLTLFHYYYTIITLLALQPTACRLICGSLDHTQWHTATVSRTPLVEWSARCIPDDTQHLQQTNIHASSGMFFFLSFCPSLSTVYLYIFCPHVT